ncbi:DotU family type IV/VI secretion system protein [Lacibacterium aquatile]|uniref:DotU family type IV/VI secretion system protein n=1 Tax=Lacibacterium aquatile TaxID=1168082 RepID=A0ABW5DUV2_9PROT
MLAAQDIKALRYEGLAREFLAFQAEIEQHRSEIAAASGLPEDSPLHPRPARIRDDLQEFLRVQAELARRRLTDAELLVYREAQYVMAALADDLFLHEVEWAGRDDWREDILEYRLFGTRVAGEKIFDNITGIAQGRGRREQELAPVYLLALALGFKGKHRSSNGAAMLEAASLDLFQAIRGRRPDLGPSGQRLVNAGYANVIAGQGKRRRWPAVSWPTVIVAIVAVFLAASTGIWFFVTADVASAADAVIRAAR